ncbi:MAG: LPS assembly protein LptD, partial [Gemmataceae bacterium]|nr:LPS assembly protein LptD [Gemmataceae bacterium]
TQPPPPVPPRTAYQLPRPRPEDPAADRPDLSLPRGFGIPVPGGPGGRTFRFGPRYGRENNIERSTLPDGTQRWVVTGGWIVNVSGGPNQPAVEFATDTAVMWISGPPVEAEAGGFQTNDEGRQQIEVYLAGNVEVRTAGSARFMGQPVTQTLRADEVYYDVSRSRAVALMADLELSTPRLPDPVHLTGREIDRLDRENWEVRDGSVFSSKLPSAPGLRLDSPRASLREREVNRRNIFGFEYRDFDGNPVRGYERLLTLRNATTRFEGVPVFYTPYLRTDATDPLGPLVGIGAGQDRIFGTQAYTTWDVYKLLALRPPPGHKWRLHVDYLSDRGPAGGTDYGYTIPSRFPDNPVASGSGFARLYGISDGGVDVLGGDRGPQPTHESARGRALWRHQQELTDALYFQGQIAYLSDQNFLEQFYKPEFDLGPNQETFGYLTWQRENLWASGLAQQRLGQDWFTRTNWLPRVDGAVVGQSFWDLFVYNARANAGYNRFRPAEGNPQPVEPTDQVSVNTGRFDLGQELSLPFALGPVKLAPYGVLDLAYYTEDLTGNDRGRVYGGGGVRTSLPFGRLYEDAASELFNVRGLYHKVTLGTNYYAAQSDTPYTRLPQLDRLNDDVLDYTYRYARPRQGSIVGGPAGQALATSPLFDPQTYAIRRLVGDRVDTLDDIQVLQAEVRQRLQTKRGYPGLEHTVDVAALDLSGSFFPDPARDNFGKSFAFLEYAALWNVGDRVALLSNGWFDPFDFGARYWTVGAALDRPDRTNFFLGYRQTDPLNSKQVTFSVGYQLTRRYYTNVGVSYDFGIQQALSNTLSVVRTGSDVTVSLGFTYNALVNNFGVQFLVIPNLVAFSSPGRFGSSPVFGGRQ